jgi:hypothetical protein
MAQAISGFQLRRITGFALEFINTSGIWVSGFISPAVSGKSFPNFQPFIKKPTVSITLLLNTGAGL